MINEHKGHAFKVRFPNGHIGKLTTSLAMFREVWEPQGYSMKCDLSQFEEPEPEEVEAVESTDSKPDNEAEDRPRKRAVRKRVDLPTDAE